MTQRLFPNADVSTGAWSLSGGSDLYAMIDEDVDSNDGAGTYVYNINNHDIFKVSLSSGGKPSDLTGWFIRFAWTLVGTGFDTTLIIELRESGNLIATASALMEALNPYGFETTIEYELTPDEVGLLTGLDGWELWVDSNDLAEGEMQITALELRIPDAQVIEPIKHGYI